MNKQPSPKLIAALASVFVVVLGVSIWGIFAAGSSNAADLLSSVESTSSATSSTASVSRVASTSGSSASSSSGSSSSASGEEDSANAGADGQASSYSYREPEQVTQVVGVRLTVDTSVLPGGGLLVSANLTLEPGTSVLQALQLTGALVVAAPNTGNGTYVSAIEGYGPGMVSGQPNSGWNYLVNGWAPNYACDKYILSDGDVVEWRYVEHP